MAGVAALLGFGAFVAVCLSVGARLLLLARRTRQVPEFAIGGALFAGGIGYTLFILAFSLRLLPDALLRPAHTLAMASLDLGVVSLCLGVWQIFRPGKSWAEAVFALVAVSLTIHLTASVASFQPSGHRDTITFWLFNAVGASAYAWAAFECFRYHGLLRRRARLGLVDAELVARFLLWGIASSCGFMLFAVGMANRLSADTGVNPIALLVQPFFGAAGGVCIWLAFFPPRFYSRRVAAREA